MKVCAAYRIPDVYVADINTLHVYIDGPQCLGIVYLQKHLPVEEPHAKKHVQYLAFQM